MNPLTSSASSGLSEPPSRRSSAGSPAGCTGGSAFRFHGAGSLGLLLLFLSLSPVAEARWVLVGNENKIDLLSGSIRTVPPAGPDSLSLLDFATDPPTVTEILNVPNSVVGPPSNLAMTPDGRLALVADSIQINPAAPGGWSPASRLHVVDLEARRIIAEVTTGRQPSGLSLAPDGKSALVANRADGTVTVLQIQGREVRPVETVLVCRPEESASDVAIAPDGGLALVSVSKGGYLTVLRLEQGRWKATGRKVSAFGQPYRCVITPDGALGLTAGAGYGNGLDQDAVSVIDLRARPIQTIGYVPIGSNPESIEISPDGRLLAAVVMDGSNLAPDNPLHHPQARLEILARRGREFKRVQTLPVGAIPEGAAFTRDGRFLVVPCHPSSELWIFQVRGEHVTDTGRRIHVPGHPSSIRAGP